MFFDTNIRIVAISPARYTVSTKKYLFQNPDQPTTTILDRRREEVFADSFGDGGAVTRGAAVEHRRYLFVKAQSFSIPQLKNKSAKLKAFRPHFWYICDTNWVDLGSTVISLQIVVVQISRSYLQNKCLYVCWTKRVTHQKSIIIDTSSDIVLQNTQRFCSKVVI